MTTRMHKMRIYCMMLAGKPTTAHLMEVLFINAYEMWDEKKEHQEIRSSRYVGCIETDLEVIIHMGVPCVAFKSIVTETQEKWGANEVLYIVRIDDLDVPPNIAYGRIRHIEGEEGPPPMDFMLADADDDDPYDDPYDPYDISG